MPVPTNDDFMQMTREQVNSLKSSQNQTTAQRAVEHSNYRDALDAYGYQCSSKATYGPGSNPPGPPPPPPGV